MIRVYRFEDGSLGVENIGAKPVSLKVASDDECARAFQLEPGVSTTWPCHELVIDEGHVALVPSPVDERDASPAGRNDDEHAVHFGGQLRGGADLVAIGGVRFTFDAECLPAVPFEIDVFLDRRVSDLLCHVRRKVPAFSESGRRSPRLTTRESEKPAKRTPRK